MNLPTLTQLAKETAYLERYQDGKLWYSITWTDEMFTSHEFEFPIATDAPLLTEACIEAVQALHIHGEAELIENYLRRAVVDQRVRGAGGGEFLAEDKGLRFLRWIRPHLEMLREAQDQP